MKYYEIDKGKVCDRVGCVMRGVPYCPRGEDDHICAAEPSEAMVAGGVSVDYDTADEDWGVSMHWDGGWVSKEAFWAEGELVARGIQDAIPILRRVCAETEAAKAAGS